MNSPWFRTPVLPRHWKRHRNFPKPSLKTGRAHVSDRLRHLTTTEHKKFAHALISVASLLENWNSKTYPGPLQSYNTCFQGPSEWCKTRPYYQYHINKVWTYLNLYHNSHVTVAVANKNAWINPFVTLKLPTQHTTSNTGPSPSTHYTPLMHTASACITTYIARRPDGSCTAPWLLNLSARRVK